MNSQQQDVYVSIVFDLVTKEYRYSHFNHAFPDSHAAPKITTEIITNLLDLHVSD